MEEVSVPCCSHDGADSCTQATVDAMPPAVSGVTVVSTDVTCVTDASRSHTPPERDVNSSKSSCVSTVISVGTTAENVSSRGVLSAALLHCALVLLIIKHL